MSSPSARKSKSARRSHHHYSHPPDEIASARDAAIYAAYAIVGVFIAFLASIITEGEGWKPILIGYVLAIGFLVHLYAFQAYQGKKLEGWKRPLARLPLRFAGYGARGARPLDAAKGEQRAMTVILLSIALWMVVIATVSMLWI